jgi:hypothetical protein
MEVDPKRRRRITMFGLSRLWRYGLDLDADWVAQIEFDLVSDEELRAQWRESSSAPDWRMCLAWIASLLFQSLRNRATVVHLLRDRAVPCLRQLAWGPGTVPECEREWYELAPLRPEFMDSSFRAVRLIACMMLWSKKGWIRYRYGGKWGKALCVQESPDDLVIYFGADRPALRRLPATGEDPNGLAPA